jgi:4'-phosphopantetheinyl transferase EntD
MTLERAHDVAIEQAAKARVPFVVYRFPAWPADVWGVLGRTHAEMPATAVVHETVHPPSPTMAAPSLF